MMKSLVQKDIDVFRGITMIRRWDHWFTAWKMGYQRLQTLRDEWLTLPFSEAFDGY